MKSKYSTVVQVLEEMREDNPGLDAVVIVTSDGVPFASSMVGIDELKVSAMAATLQVVAEQTIKELRSGGLKYLIITGEKGTLLIRSVGSEFTLVMLVRAESKLGLAMWQAEQAARKIEKVLVSSAE